MANYVSYTPTTAIGRALFNFDETAGFANYKYNGTVRVSVSDAFSVADYSGNVYSNFYQYLYTDVEEIGWTSQNIANIQEIFGIVSQLANITFDYRADFDLPGSDSTPNPEEVGRFNLSDINITWVYRSDAPFAGLSGGNSDSLLGYTGGAGDIFLNSWAPQFNKDFTLDLNTRGRQILMHEVGHSLGLSHSHKSVGNALVVSNDFAATQFLGFNQLGFHIDDANDMNKEYFTIMSYDDQHSLLPGSTVVFHAHTPMILDVIALQQAYGEGSGTSGSGNDTIVFGNVGYRTYFDIGGIDTIDLSAFYTEGAYLNMGVSITGAAHLVGVAMSLNDAQTTIVAGGDPAHLRWLYGEFENAIGGQSSDRLIGNALGNRISGLAGDDTIYGAAGNDFMTGGAGQDYLEGGDGTDTAIFAGTRAAYSVTYSSNNGNNFQISGPDGTDLLVNVEGVSFSDVSGNPSDFATGSRPVRWIGSVDVGSHPPGYTVAGTGDFNHDGNNDVLWFNAGNGDTDVWKTANGKWAGSVNIGKHPLGYSVAGVGDFNNDGTDDVLWYNQTTTSTEIWKISNGGWAGSVDIGLHPAGWKPAGIGDFDQNGGSDVLWFNQSTGNTEIWKLADGKWAGSVNIGNHPAGYTVAGVGDFNADGTDDVLWFNAATGDAEIWKLSNGKWAGSVDIGLHPPGWKPSGVGDFNRDGTDDVLWFEAASGATDIWLINNGRWAGSVTVGAHPLGWTPVGVGDLDHNGTPDITWQQNGVGHVEQWLLA